MIDGTVFSAIFVDNSKRRAGDDIIDAEFFADGFDECGLTGAHLSVEGKYLVVTHVVDKLPGCLPDVVEITNCYFHIYSFLSLLFIFSFLLA